MGDDDARDAKDVVWNDIAEQGKSRLGGSCARRKRQTQAYK